MVEGEAVVEIPDDIIRSSVPLWEDLLEGRFLAKAPHVGKIHVIVNKIWSLGDKSIRIDVFAVNATTVKFIIKDPATRKRILRRGMWNIADIPMVVSKWCPILEEEEEPEIKTIPMWITLKNVPHKMFSWEGLSFISSAACKPKRLHPETELCSSFEEAKIFVEADMTKELPKRHIFKSKLGVDADVEFVYPWLPERCSRCSKWGHLESVCVIKGGLKNRASEHREKEEEGKGKKTVRILQRGEDYIGLSREQIQVNKTDLSNKEEIPPPQTNATRKIVVVNDSDEGNAVMESHGEVVEGNWLKVSPGKLGRSKDKGQSNVKTVVSHSRFGVLEKEVESQEEEEMAEKEEGEISQSATDERRTEIGIEQRVRSSLRSSEASTKQQSTGLVLHTKQQTPSVSGKRKVNKKK